MIRKRWLTIFLILLMGGSAFAGGITVTGQIKGHNDNNAPAGWAVECWEGSIATSPNGPKFTLDPNETLSPEPPNPVTTNGSGRLCPAGDPGTDGFYDPRSSKSVTIRVWEGSDPAAVIGAQGYYGYGSYSIGTENAPPAYTTQNIKTELRAAPPDEPTVSAGNYNLAWNDGLGQFLVSFTLTAHAGTGWQSEGASYQIRVRKPTDAYDPMRTHDGASWNVTETDLNNPYFVGGGTYVAQARAANAFGETWGPEMTFQIPATAMGAGAIFNLDLYKYETNKIVVNPIAVPSNTLKDGSVATAYELAAFINGKAGKTIVTAVYLWDASTGTPQGVTFAPDGKLATGSDFSLKPGVGYQVYTTENINITFEGQ